MSSWVESHRAGVRARRRTGSVSSFAAAFADSARKAKTARWPGVRTGIGCALVASVLAAATAAADGTAWLPEPRAGYVGLSWIHQSADQFYRADEKRPTPGAADLAQGTFWLTAAYAPAEDWTVDVQAGWAKSDYITGEGIPTTAASFSGITDATVGLTRRLTDEAAGPFPSVALRLGGIAAGNYRTGQINSLGDGGNGYELSAIIGKFVGGRVGVSGEIGYRGRGNGIPSERYANVAGLWLVSDAVTLGAEYRAVDARSGLDIGAPGFTPARFPELEEDHRSVGLRLYFNLAGVGLNVFHSRVLDGRNTAASRVYGLSASRAFGGY